MSGDSAEALSVAYWKTYKKFLENGDEYDGNKLLAVFTHGPGQIHNSKKEIESVADLNGMKFRVPGGIAAQVAASLGIVGIQKPASQVYELLSSGAIDGVLLPQESIISFEILGVVPYTTLVPGGLYNVAFYLVMNQETFNGFSQADQNTVMAESGEKFAVIAGGAWDREDRIGLQAIKDAGNTVTVASPAFLADIATATKDVETAWVTNASTKGVDGSAALNYFRETAKNYKNGDINNSPTTPGLLYPIDNASNVLLTTDLAIDDFSDPDTDDTHSQTQWQISTQSDFSIIILSETSTTHLTSLPVPDLALIENTKYYWRAKVYDNSLNTSEWSETYSFTTINAQSDQNDDGIPDTLENSTLDIDSDGIADSLQSYIKSLNTVVGDGHIGVSFENSATVTSIESIDSIDPDEISEEKRPQTMPLGLFALRLNVENPGDTAEVTIYFSEAAPEGAIWYLYDSINGWADYSQYATFSDDRKSIMVKLKDGDYGDADGIANGIIVDPCGYGIASWLKGCITDASTSQAISTAKIAIKELGISLTCLSDGNFISMILPGTYDVTISASGYQSKTISSLVIDEANIVSQDVALTPNNSDDSSNSNSGNTSSTECPVKIQGISLSQAPVVNTPVTITANAQDSCSNSIYYRFSVHPDYGTSGYDGSKWASMTTTEYSTNNSIQYTFDKEGKYIVVIWAVTDPDNIDYQSIPIAGYSVDVGASECKTDILGCTITGTQKSYRSIKLTANAQNSCNKDLYYRFSVHPYYGTHKYDGLRWTKMTETEWISNNSIDYTFTRSGKYIVVIWATDNPENYNVNGIPIIGWSMDVE